MCNCLIAQSGGPTSVINSSVVGLVDENTKLNIFNTVYGGLNGIEGILNENLINLSTCDKNILDTFKLTPSSGLGSCRYKMKDYNNDESEYIKIFDIFQKLNIKAFFYIGGNDSMDTVSKLSKYAENKNIDVKIIGIPKTIDNDLPITDHTPGFGSAAKFISTVALETYLDSSVYINNGIFILETMGRDAGWLAASASLAKLNNKPIADFIYLPEIAFDTDAFIKDVKEKFKKQNHVYIVASEGLKDNDGNFLSTLQSAECHDNFGHAQLGGVGNYLKSLILDNHITTRVKSLELGVLQRCAMHISSSIDVEEAYVSGAAALRFAKDGMSGYMVGIKRMAGSTYLTETFPIKASTVANNVKYIPRDWINKEGNGVNELFYNYANPLISGNVELLYKDCIPSYHIFNK
ncbi:6-phosphofructokinase [Clostridium algidicarnis]|uniref:6-phosphofructokinase n=1 Tax=Clostridium algidicarnis TaxID=37659 RepID=UPI001626005E|nr:6-phosphofructokinase [Clostridium algidicarnis]MBB6632005.1 6-phosphofructokinase [Clostridium algidicarnis]MBU3202595.1 6-phosphofructokinase [Clostridium algidicarnis]MBU3206935.1 6-phosphofructokinase [Clostridium algidicarnis]MBU3210749.1 6-phosphofructokinase [Clostridium algidicarnis]MBU3222743.1 6-phosphofructokinase [Clostridium algidicarnis]